ncbi:hypothetical protein EA187_08405 [Lujinxingia sediminis]|uniref:Potassium transporter TrkH n=1 Tax=Lujinxingia sediminis TaxID=2480984 RepID=A0ABY0CTX2_9DELT|nr:potassium transporter TrkG [Lujinxingia sediminis]RVU45775.1 hypothetical protein EA187_08405 [Lujinxingia sediminis]
MADLGTSAERRLAAARFMGANIFSAFAQLAVDMPNGYFGGADEVTEWGQLYTMVLLGSTLLALWGYGRNHPRVVWLVGLTCSLSIGVFMAALAVSPIIPAGAMIWNLVVLAWTLFPLRLSGPRSRAAMGGKQRESRLDRWSRKNGAGVRHLLWVSLILNVGVVGFELSGQNFVVIATMAFAMAVSALTAPAVGTMVRERRLWTLLILVPLFLMAFFLGSPQVLLLLLGLYQFAMLFVLSAREPIFNDVLDYFYEYPALLVLTTFATLTAVGTLLLSLPAASATGVPVSPIDAFFTATSASCITGLIVLDTPVAFTFFGHVVILALIQMGGIGILVLSTFATLLLGSRLGMRAERALEEVLDLPGSQSSYSLAKFIVGSTLAIEGLGAIGLTVVYLRHGYAFGEAAWMGVFHAISAFCHAGFALQSDSLMMFHDDPLALTIFSVLVTLGSVGFLVLAVAWQWLRGERRRVNVQARLIGFGTVGLIVAGMVLFFICEWNGVLADMTWRERFFNALMQSVTLRSSGFNSVDTTVLSPATMWFMIFFMFIGGAPGSTAGGIKLTTLVVLLFAVRGIASGTPRVVLFRREIPQEIVYRSAGITVISIMLGFALLFMLLLTQPIPFEMLAFEAASALGTVGLSVGATSELNDIGKLLIVLVIFIGRVGPLALALVLGRGTSSRLSYPEARVMVG